MKNPAFSIVFPVMNQEDHIEEVIRTYHKELNKHKFSFELIAVVNCSNDRSFDICKKVSKELLGVKSYVLSGCGYGLGIRYGLKKAKGKYLCYLNCARIHSPDLIRCLKHFNVDKNVLVHGVRIFRKKKIRRFGSLLYNLFFRVIFKIQNRDINGNPNVFSRKTYEKIKLSFDDSMIDLELLESTRVHNIPVVEVPVFDYTRHGGRSTTNFRTIFRLLKELIRYWLKTRSFS